MLAAIRRSPHRTLLYAYAALLFTILLIPLLIVVIVSFSSSSYLTFPPPSLSTRWYESILGSENWRTAFWTSVQSACLATVLALIAGLCAAVALVRGRVWGRSAAYLAILAPAIVPTVVTAAALYLMFAKLHLVGSVVGIGIGQSIVSLPFVVIILSATLQGFDVRLEQAAVSLGASPLRAFVTVTVPIIRPALISATVFAFLNAFDEVLIALFLSGPTTATLPVMIWNSVIFSIEPSVAAVSTGIMAVALLLFGAAALLNRRRGRRPGRAAGETRTPSRTKEHTP